LASDQLLWIPTDISVGPCSAESATGPMEEYLTLVRVMFGTISSP